MKSQTYDGLTYLSGSTKYNMILLYNTNDRLKCQLNEKEFLQLLVVI